MIESDSMDGRAMGCMKNPALENATPALDRLAQMGAIFENTYSNNPICCCSRASMWSGRYTFNCHAWNNYKGLPRSTTTAFMELAEAGYNVKSFGKTDYYSGGHSSRARVTAWTRSASIPRGSYNMGAPIIYETEETRVHENDWNTVDKSIAWLNENAQSDQPFFLYVGVNAPHPEFYTSRYYLEKVDQSKIEIPPQDIKEHPVMAYQRISKAWRHGTDEETVRKVRAIYYAMVAETDAMVARVIEQVDCLGLWEDTYLIYTSDHGEMNLEHGQFYKMNMFEPSLRVPLIMAGADVKPGTKISDPVSLVDIYPTLMSMGRTSSCHPLDGQTLLDAARTMPCALRPYAFSEYHDTTVNTGTAMVRSENHKYIAFEGYEPLLFDLQSDPWEIHNLADSLPEKAREMKQLLNSVMDLEKVDAHVKEYDRDSFRVWRQEQLASGSYYDAMALIYSGFDEINACEIKPWTQEEEAALLEWLEQIPGKEKPFIAPKKATPDTDHY